jgi:hypothetical protein
MPRAYFGNQTGTMLKIGVVELEMRDTDIVRRETVLSENKTYQQTRWTFEVNAVWSPLATSYTAGRAGPPILLDGQPAAITDQSIRHYLMQPRPTIIYQSGDNVLLQCPAPGYTTDAENGPYVEECNVTETHGFRTFIIHLKIVCLVNECSGNIPLLSHEWSRKVAYDQDYFATLVTVGKAVFRSDVLKKLGTVPDQYRRNFMHPVPDYCQRTIDFVEAEADNVTINYQVSDRRLAVSIGPNSPVNRWEGYYTASMSQVGLDESQLNWDLAYAGAGLNALTAGRDIAAGFASGGIAGGLGNAAVTLVGMGLGDYAKAVAINATRIPLHKVNILLKAWGGPYDDNYTMMQWCITLIMACLNDNLASLLPTYSRDISISFQLNGRYVEISFTKRYPMGTFNNPTDINALLNGQPVGAFPTDVNGGVVVGNSSIYILSDSGVGHVLNNAKSANDGLTFAFAGRTANPPRLQNAFRNRGNFLVTLITQALSQPCTLPPAIPANQNLADINLYPSSNTVL